SERAYSSDSAISLRRTVFKCSSSAFSCSNFSGVRKEFCASLIENVLEDRLGCFLIRLIIRRKSARSIRGGFNPQHFWTVFCHPLNHQTHGGRGSKEARAWATLKHQHKCI